MIFEVHMGCPLLDFEVSVAYTEIAQIEGQLESFSTGYSIVPVLFIPQRSGGI